MSLHLFLKDFFHFRLDDIQHKMNTLNTNRETVERMATNSRDDIENLALKVDNIGLELKDMQGAIKLQNKMFDNHALRMVSKKQQTSFFLTKTSFSFPLMGEEKAL